MTVEAYLDRWMRDTSSRHWRRRRLAYRDAIRRHFIPALGRLELAGARPTHIQSLYTLRGRLLTAVGPALPPDPPRRAPSGRPVAAARAKPGGRGRAAPPARRELRATTPEQARAVMAAADENAARAVRPAGPPDRDASGELLGLRWPDVDLDDAALNVQQTAQRIAGGHRVPPAKDAPLARAIALSADAVGRAAPASRGQAEARLLAGSAYQDRDLVFATGSGRRSSRATRGRGPASSRGRPARSPIHDLRHAHATLMLGGRPPEDRVRAARPRQREHHVGHLQPRPARPPGGRGRGARRPARRAATPRGP